MGFGRAGGLPAASGAKLCPHLEDAAAVSVAQQPQPKQHADDLTRYTLFFIHKEVGSELGTALTWKAKPFKIQMHTPRVDLKRYREYRHTSS